MKHSLAETLSECEVFCGSKYVWSDISGCFRTIETQLNEGSRVLFTGTPCQIAALKQLLKKKDVSVEKLFTVDIVCHGTPNPVVWCDYVRHLETKYNSKLVEFSFRYKPHGWKGYPIYARFADGKKVVNRISISSYQNMFRKNILMRESCFKCPYPGRFQSDLTICDFWGVENCMPKIRTKGGVSLIQVHTEKGNNIIDIMKKKNGVTLLVVPDDRYIKFNHNLIAPTKRPDNYEKFWVDYQEQGIEYVLKKYGGENFTGKLNFYGKDILRQSGLLDRVRKLMGRV